MKNPLLALASLALVLPASAVEYVTLTPATATKNVSSTDLVEIVGTTLNSVAISSALSLTFADAPSSPVAIELKGKEGASNPAAFDDMKGNVFTGLTSITLLQGNAGTYPAAVTLKITPAEEISVASEGTVLVVPDSTTGDLVVLTESSDDMVTWSTFLSQVITAGSDPKFYRTRIIKNVSP